MDYTHTSHLPSGLRQSNLKKSFKRGVRSLLTTCSKEEFCNMFSTFGSAEQEHLHRLFIQVITSLHENIEGKLGSICEETQVGTTLDTIEQLVEEHSLDILSAEKTNLGDVKEEVSEAKKDEIHYLTSMLEKVVEQNNLTRAHVESLKKRNQDFSPISDSVGKLRNWNVMYGQSSLQKKTP
ncbi:embryo defective 3006 [Tasmannia lanceolata]|uniref:embryo defective 3006 n=1 Tax=Tasmannia lanceolata TaxID=3420 RepID=UPI0040643D6C